MDYSHAKVDLEKLPEGVREMVIHVAERHNALVNGVNELKLDLDGVTGKTPEEKAEAHGFLAKARKIIHFIHSKRFAFGGGTIVTYFGLGILDRLGLDPTEVSRLLETLLRVIEKIAGLF